MFKRITKKIHSLLIQEFKAMFKKFGSSSVCHSFPQVFHSQSRCTWWSSLSEYILKLVLMIPKKS